MANGRGDLIISISEARKLLGNRYSQYPDSDIEMLIRKLDLLVEAYIRAVPEE